MIKKYIFKLTFFIFILTLGVQGVFAEVKRTTIPVEDQNDFVVEPGKSEIVIKPGETVIKNLTITSRIKKTIKFRISTEDLVGGSDASETVVLLGEERGPYSLKDFLIPEVKDFTLKFGERISIPITIAVPKNAEPRGYYGAVIVANQPDNEEEGNVSETKGKTRIISRIGSLFLVKIEGQGIEGGKLFDFKTLGPKKFIYENRPPGFEVAFENTGTVHLVPYGFISIKNMVGTEISKLPIDAYFSLPSSVRYREVNWDKGFSFGRYTASLSLYKGYGEGFESKTISFWVLPWKILVAVLVGIILLFISVRYIFTRFEIKKKQ